MADKFLNYLGDPWNSDAIATPKRCKSAYYSGTFEDIIAPSTANYPEDDTSKTRYLISLPFVPHSDLSTYPLVIRDGTSGTALTRVTSSPGTNEFRIAPSTSKRPHLVELHSGQAGHTIQFDGYAIGGILNAVDVNAAIYKTSAGVYSLKRLRHMIVEIGDWDMDASDSVTKLIGPTTLFNKEQVVSVRVFIRPDTVIANVYNLEMAAATVAGIAEGGIFSIQEITSNIYVVLQRRPSGYFDMTDFNATSYNRGWICVTFWEI